MSAGKWWPELESNSIGDATIEYERGTGGTLVNVTGEAYRTNRGITVYLDGGMVQIPEHRIVTIRLHQPAGGE